ncbi:MAG: glycerophosphodiester phosphodiesterase [Clostridia bacterium]|nr:glycerophosphodiester phosphodiesterase [Clostridia bacterium]
MNTIPKPGNGLTYTAHTGCVDTTDNSLESIDAAVKYGAAIVEFDLNFTADGTAVLSHDKPKGNEVTLSEAFKRISSFENLLVNVDVKNTSHLEAVKPLAEKHGIADRFFYTGITESDCASVSKKSPGVPYYLNTKVRKLQSKKYLEKLTKKVSDCGAIGINFNKKNASKKLVDFFHEKGLLVSIWTANSEEDINRLLSFSPDNITTRRPDLFKSIIEKK